MSRAEVWTAEKQLWYETTVATKTHTCVFCKKQVDPDADEDAGAIPTFWQGEEEYCGRGQCVCSKCTQTHLQFDAEDQIYFLPIDVKVPEGTGLFMVD